MQRAERETEPGIRAGTLVVLNGASSSGKTLTALALQPLLGPTCIRTGFDHMLARLRPFGSDPDTWDDYLRWWARVLRFRLTGGRLQLFGRLHREAAALTRAGHPVIVETSLIDQRALYDAAACFAPLGGLFVGMKPPLEVSEQWEAGREDRTQGQARRHYARVHSHGVYDLLVDPSALTPQECAVAITRRLGNEQPASAFQRLLEGGGKRVTS